MSPGVDLAIARWRELLARDPIASDVDGLRHRIREAGLSEGGRPICRVLRPRFVTSERREAEGVMARRVVGALGRALRAVEDGAIPEGATGGLRDWARRVRALDPSSRAGIPSFLRLDASLARTRLHVLELNADMPAGEAHNDSVVDFFESLETTRAFQETGDGTLLRLLPGFDRVVDAAVARPVGERPRIAWVTWDETPERRKIVRTMATHLEARGARVVFADPRELEVRSDRTWLAGEAVDAILRLCSTPEILERLDDAADLVAAARSGHTPVLNPLGTEPLGHKALLAVITDPSLETGLSVGERRAVAQHVPWTRVLRDTRSSDPGGEEVDLLPWVLDHRVRLVLKPAHGLAGRGVVLGWRTTAGEWERAVRSGLGRDVVQHRVHLQRERYPVIDQGLDDADFYEDTDPFLFDAEAGGVLTRLSSSEITNVTAGGGVTATMVI